MNLDYTLLTSQKIPSYIFEYKKYARLYVIKAEEVSTKHQFEFIYYDNLADDYETELFESALDSAIENKKPVCLDGTVKYFADSKRRLTNWHLVNNEEVGYSYIDFE